MKFSEFMALIRLWIGFVNSDLLLLIFLILIIFIFVLIGIKKTQKKINQRILEHERMINILDVNLGCKQDLAKKQEHFQGISDREVKKIKKQNLKNVNKNREKEIIDLQKDGEIFSQKMKKIKKTIIKKEGNNGK